MENKAKELLLELGMASEETIIPFYPRARDREDIEILRDRKSGVIFLSKTDHMSVSHYDEIDGGTYWGGKTRDEALKLYHDDDIRRSEQFRSLIEGKDVIDIGCGTGALLDYWKGVAKKVDGVEPQEYIRKELQALGHTVYHLPQDAPKEQYDVATLFHVVEHVIEPLAVLSRVRETLRPGGIVVIEVPHARDALLQLDSFKAFSLWSEHLILHTKESLHALLERAGFKNIQINGFQRYPLANHVGWFVDGKPGGQNRRPELRVQGAEEAYEKILKESDQTDTLIAIAHND
ncbi:class I SAM-dependent methyltransferase [Acetobacteraceae bacterium]|nr:class I SAM-dependent methyltransferase [Candidatus Parcubacteria bacterium]